jgi:hypothetical protein
MRPTHVALLCLAIAAGCGATVYVSSPSPLIVATATPLPSSAPPAATTPPASSEGSAELFLAQFGAVPPPFHVRIETTLIGSPGGTAVEEADVDGADYVADLHVELEGAAAQDSHIIVVDKMGYVADAGSDTWRAYPDYETVPPVNPFLGLDSAAWSELGADPTHGGLDHLNSTVWRLPPDSSVAERVKDVNFDLWLDSTGLPVSGRLSMALAALDEAAEVGYQASYTFSRVGEPVAIKPPVAVPSEVGSVFTVRSSAVAEGGAIPTQYTCDGANSALPVSWSDVPTGTAELALVMDDPDARGFVHWVVVGIPADATAAGGAPLPADAREGRNDFGKVGYGGPCPPSGTHRYTVTVYALSKALSVSVTPTADEVRSAAAGSILAQATLTGTYRRGG